MPYDPSGNFTLLNSFGSGTNNDNNFPNAVGLTLNDIASSITVTAMISNTAFQTQFVLTGTSTTIKVGYLITPYNAGTLSSGTFTPNAVNGNYQYLTNNGAFAWAVPAADSTLDILVTNGATAGVITFSGGYTVASGNTGDPLTTTNGNKFIVSIRRINGVSTYLIKALQ